MEINPNKIGKQFKSMPLKVKEYNVENRKISGYAAVFNNKDKAGDILIKGCFSKSINDRGPESSANDKIIMLWMHDMKEPIGRITALYEDEKGLYFEAVIDNVERGEQALKQLESGTLNQFSIGYSYVWDKCKYDNERDAFIVKEVVLYEISVVSIGCNGETEYLGLKSDLSYDDKIDEVKKYIEDETKGLPIREQERILSIVSKIMPLAAFKPISSLKKEEAGGQNKSMFDNLKFK